MSSVLVNGEPGATVSPLDRGLQYGDGLFETLAIRAGRPRFLDWHLERLAEGASRLGLPLPGMQLIRDEIARVAPAGEGVVKLLLTRGVDARGYRPPAGNAATRIVAGFAPPAWPPKFWEQGVRLRWCQTRLGHNPALAGIKHLNRLEQVLARAEWQDEDVPEGLMCDAAGAVVCGTQANLFAFRDGRLLTPGLEQCGVAGIMRRALCHWATMTHIAVTEQTLMPAELEGADELLLTNTLIGAWPVRDLEGRPCRQAGLARRFNRWLESQ